MLFTFSFLPWSSWLTRVALLCRGLNERLSLSLQSFLALYFPNHSLFYAYISNLSPDSRASLWLILSSRFRLSLRVVLSFCKFSVLFNSRLANVIILSRSPFTFPFWHESFCRFLAVPYPSTIFRLSTVR